MMPACCFLHAAAPRQNPTHPDSGPLRPRARPRRRLWQAFRSAVVFCASVLGILATEPSPAVSEEADPVIEEKPLSQLIKQLRSDNRGLQLRSAQALGKAPAEFQARIVSQLLPVLNSERENDRFVAAQVLGGYGPVSRPAVSALLPMLEGTQFERNRAAAAKALGQILCDAKPDPEIEKVAQALAARFNEAKDNYSDVRREAVYALGMIGPAAKSVISKLVPALTDPGYIESENGLVRRAAAWACGRMGSLAAEHMDRLISMLQAEGEWAPEYAEAIGRIGPLNPNVVLNLIDKMEKMGVADHWTAFRLTLWQALERFGPQAAPAVPLMNRFLKEKGASKEYFQQRVALLKAAAEIGSAAQALLPEIKSLQTYSNYGDWRIPKEENDKLHADLHTAASAALAKLSAAPPLK